VGVDGSVEQLLFRPGDPAPVLAFMSRLSVDGDGWVNLSPVPEEATAPARSRWLPHLFDLLLDAGPDIPVCTWVPERKRRRRVEPASIGVQHPSGQRALDRLHRAGIDPPSGWRLVQDHPRRGLVFRAAAETDLGATLEWLIRAGEYLTLGPPAASWLATVHRRSDPADPDHPPGSAGVVD
jgi:hypothetical protein